MEEPIKEENSEENLEKQKNMIQEAFDYEKRQWKYKTIALIVFFVVVAVIATSAITYYITLGSKYNNLYESKTEVTETEETVEAGELVSSISSILESFADVIDENYIGDIDKQELIDSTIKGFVEGIGDEYSEYMTADEWEEYQESALGNYVGVGIYMTTDDDGNIIIISTISDTPAEQAGIQSEDIIVAVDGESVEGLTVTEVSNAVKGEEGTEVTITIYRNGEYIDYTLERQNIKVYHVETEMLDETTGYIELLTFDEGCAEEFEAGMDELIQQGATKIIFDLRYNTGGLVNEALDIIDLFVDKGTTTLIDIDAKGNETVTTSSTDKKYDVEMVILVNEYTASASEIVTGSLMDNEVATSVGTITYGKGVIQNVYQLYDGSILKLTTAEYYTPNRNEINKVGITPDYEVELETTTDENGEETVVDTQLQKAQELLQ